MNNNNKEENKIISQLVFLYFQYNPEKNKGINWRIKANDIIRANYLIDKHTKEEIEDCIKSSPHCKYPIWTQFEIYFKNKKKKSNYKNSINDSTNPDDWI